MIVDDESLVRSGIRRMLRAVADVVIVGEAETGEEAVSLIRRERPELVFLDVRLPGIDGFDVLADLRVELPPAIIVITAHGRYAPRAFDHHAVDYLLKPFDAARFHTALARARARLLAGAASSAPVVSAPMREADGSRSYIERILVQRSGRSVVVSVDDIDWLEAADNYVCIHSGKARHLIRMPLAELEARLDPGRFIRVHRSTIVRTKRIRELRAGFGGRYEVVLASGVRLALSRTYRDAARRALAGPGA